MTGSAVYTSITTNTVTHCAVKFWQLRRCQGTGIFQLHYNGGGPSLTETSRVVSACDFSSLLPGVRKGLWFHCCVGVSFPFHGDGRLMTDYCLNNSNWFCTWDLEMLNNVLWKSIQYYSKYGIGQISLLREFMKNQMLLPRFISLNSNNIQHKIIFCPMILNRILVRVLMGLTHCMNYHPDFSGNFCYVPDWG